MAQFEVELVVRPKLGIADPAGEAVDEVLRNLGYQAQVLCVARTLFLRLDATDNEAATREVRSMCERVLVNPNIETYDLRISKK